MSNLPIARDGCRCICHRQEGVRHFMACCGTGSFRKVPVFASGIEAAEADETRSGSAEGESPAPEGGDAQ